MLYPDHVFRLRPLIALSDLEFYQVTFLESFVTIALNGGIVNKHVRPVVLADKPITLSVVEPFYFSSSACQLAPPFSKTLRVEPTGRVSLTGPWSHKKATSAA